CHLFHGLSREPHLVAQASPHGADIVLVHRDVPCVPCCEPLCRVHQQGSSQTRTPSHVSASSSGTSQVPGWIATLTNGFCTRCSPHLWAMGVAPLAASVSTIREPTGSSDAAITCGGTPHLVPCFPHATLHLLPEAGAT